MGNITGKFSYCTKEGKSQQIHETSPRLKLSSKKRGRVLEGKNEKQTPGCVVEERAEVLERKNEEQTPGYVLQRQVPTEIIIEILSRLPVKSVLKFQVVSKKWYDITQDRYFVEKHMSRAEVVSEFDVKYCILVPGHENIRCLANCDGLHLVISNFTKKYQIKNPATRKVLDLPDPHKGSVRFALSFIPSTKDYKVVSIYDDGTGNGTKCCEVLTIGSDTSWRPLEMPILKVHNKKVVKFSLVRTRAAVHCFWIGGSDTDISEVVSLDIETECMTVTTLPKGMYSKWDDVKALRWSGKLGFADRENGDLCVRVLEDYKRHRWGERKTVVPLALLKENEGTEGELVPFLFDCDNLWLWKNKELFHYNMTSGRILADGNKMYTKPSLVTLKGMRGEE